MKGRACAGSTGALKCERLRPKGFWTPYFWPSIRLKLAESSLASKLASINLLLLLALLMVAVPAWFVLPGDRAAAHAVADLSRALRAVQNADMLHDSLQANVLSALLRAELVHTSTEHHRTHIQDDAAGFRREWAVLEQIPFPSALRERHDATRAVGLRYVDQAESVAMLALKDRPAALAAMPGFMRLFEAAKVALSEQTQDLAQARDAALAQAQRGERQAKNILLLAAVGAICIGMYGVALIGQSIRRSLVSLRDVASAIAEGQLHHRSTLRGSDEVGQLAQSINRMAGNLHDMISSAREEAEHGTFRSQLANALEMADTEAQAQEAAARAMAQITQQHAVELLLADASNAHLNAAAVHPSTGAPGCGVGSPYACVAVRNGHPMQFPNAQALDACPKLRQREQAPAGAVCVPITFMGRALGVLHATAAPEQAISPTEANRLKALGAQVGTRLGMLRAYESSQLQASTDMLTGLANRRTVERRLRDLCVGGHSFALVMCDLDHFKRLNDAHGHPAGDEALRLFADAVRHSARDEDVVGRWGGEEFAFLLARADAAEGLEWANRLRSRLAEALQRGRSAPFSASFGVVDSKASHIPEQLLRLADKALYRAKATGRDRAVLADAPAAAAAAAAAAQSSAVRAEPSSVTELESALSV